MQYKIFTLTEKGKDFEKVFYEMRKCGEKWEIREKKQN